MSLSKNQSLDDNKTSECTVFIRHKFLLSMLICLCGFPNRIRQTSTKRVHVNFFLDRPDLYLRFDCKPTCTCQSLQNKNNIYVCLERLFIKRT